MKCEICNKEMNGLRNLSSHLTQNHKIKNKKEYYDRYLKKENEGKCYFCGNDAIFFNLIKGYHRICNSKECLGKTRATGTYEFLMYKYGLSKKEALLLILKKSKERGEKIKDSLQKKFIKNNNFFKEKSHQSKEYWIKKGYSEEEAIEKCAKIMDNIHKKTSIKKLNNKELYKDIYKNQIGYWIKRGYTQEESIEKVKERQRTFTLQSCIDKYGEEEGLKIFNDRQEKWSKKIEDMYKDGKFTKFCKEPFSRGEMDLFENLLVFLDEYKEKIRYGKNQFFRYFPKIGKTFSYDFVFGKKIIEFNGDYWHCNPKFYNKNYYHKYLQMFAEEIWKKDELRIMSILEEGFEVLVVWESEYNKNREQIIEKCLNFLKNNKN